jgi:hypothetical protein
MNIINKNIIDAPNAKSSNVVLLDTAGTDLETSYPNGVYATLTYPAGGINTSINADNLSSINMNTDELEALLGGVDTNTSYQDTPFTERPTVTTGAAAVTSNVKKGWMTITVGSGTAYIGNSGVTSANGYKLDNVNPSATISSDNLNEWYIIGAAGAEEVYVIGAYIN